MSGKNIQEQAALCIADLVGKSLITQSDADHYARLSGIVQERGGTERDMALCLLHEIPDMAPSALDTFDPALKDAVTELSDVMPDFLRHGEDTLMIRASRLVEARRPAQIIWMCDLQDSVRNEMVRFAHHETSEADLADDLKGRIDGAMTLLNGLTKHKTLSLFIETVRSDVAFFSALARSGRLDLSVRQDSADAGIGAP